MPLSWRQNFCNENKPFFQQKHASVNIIFPNEIYFLTKNYNFLSIFPDNIILPVIVLFHDELSEYLLLNIVHIYLQNGFVSDYFI